jgi:hypothetical protein
MARRFTLLLCIGALMAAAGCASGTGSLTADDTSVLSDGAGQATSSAPQRPVLNCRNRGVYNRAADLCVSEGP